MNPGRTPIIMILIGMNNMPMSSDEEEAQWESTMVPMSTRTLTPTGRMHNESVIRWINIVRNLAICNAGRVIRMDLEHELRAMDQARFTTD